MIAAGIHDSLTAGFTIITLTKGKHLPSRYTGHSDISSEQ